MRKAHMIALGLALLSTLVIAQLASAKDFCTGYAQDVCSAYESVHNMKCDSTHQQAYYNACRSAQRTAAAERKKAAEQRAIAAVPKANLTASARNTVTSPGGPQNLYSANGGQGDQRLGFARRDLRRHAPRRVRTEIRLLNLC